LGKKRRNHAKGEGDKTMAAKVAVTSGQAVTLTNMTPMSG